MSCDAQSGCDARHDRLEDGRRRSFFNGSRAVGEPPIGYVRGETNGTLVVERRQAEVVRKIFRLYLQGHSFLKIAGLLNAKGHVTAGGRKWTDKTVRDVTMNEVYIGRVKYGGEYRPGHHEPIIDEVTFAAAQYARINRGRIGGRSVGSPFLLSGVAECKGCGHPLHTQPATESKRTGKDGRFYITQNPAYYQCGGRMKNGSSFCSCGNIQQGVLEAHVVERLQARFGHKVETGWLGRVSEKVSQWEVLPQNVRKQLVQYLIHRVLVWRTSRGQGRFKEAPEIEVDIVWNRWERVIPEGDHPWVEPEQEITAGDRHS